MKRSLTDAGMMGGIEGRQGQTGWGGDGEAELPAWRLKAPPPPGVSQIRNHHQGNQPAAALPSGSHGNSRQGSRGRMKEREEVVLNRGSSTCSDEAELVEVKRDSLVLMKRYL